MGFYIYQVFPSYSDVVLIILDYDKIYSRASLVAQMAKNLPAMVEIKVQSVDWEDVLEKRMAIHFSILTWKTPWREGPGGLQSLGSQKVGHD